METAQLNGHTESTVGLTETAGSRRGLLGDVLVREGLITESQLTQALGVQEKLEPRTPLGEILIQQGALTRKQLNHILDRYHKKYRLGDILVETETITENQLEIALDHQKKTGLRLGDVLLQLNFVTEEEINHALCTQFGVTFVDLDRLILDRSVAALIPKSYAQQHRVLPIAKLQNTLAVAMDDPSDLEIVSELQTSMGCKVNVVTSTHAAFKRAFSRAYGESPEAGLARQYQELKDTHQWLRGEHEATLQALTDLKRAHEALLREQEASVHLLAEQRTRNEWNTEALEELRAAQATLRHEHEATLEALTELRREHERVLETMVEVRRAHDATLESVTDLERTRETLLAERETQARVAAAERARNDEWNTEALEELRAAQATLRHEHEATLEALTELRREHERVLETMVEVRRAHDATLESVTDLERTRETLLAERETQARVAAAERARNEWNTQTLAELRTAHEMLRREHETSCRVLRDRHDAIVRDRRFPVDQLEGLFDRLAL